MRLGGQSLLLLTGLLALEKDSSNEPTRRPDHRSSSRRFCSKVLTVVALVLLPCTLLAQIPKLAAVPDTLPAQKRLEFTQKRDSLVAEKTELVAKAAVHNSKCNAVPRDTPEWKNCNDQQTELEAARQRYIDAVNKFNDEVAGAISARQSFPGNSPGPPVGAVSECRGAVFMVTTDGQRLPLEKGAPLPLNAHVTTGPDGHFKILLADGTVFTLGPDADMVLDDFVFDPNTNIRKISAALLKGTFRWITGKIARHNPEDMHVRLAVGCLGIRGTDFEVVVAPNGSGQIKLLSGELEITPHSGGLLPHPAVRNSSTFLLNAGELVTFAADGTFGAPRPIPSGARQ